MLFLNSLPFTEFKDLRQLFSVRGGFIHAPKLWVAYIGSLLWRYNESLPVFDEVQMTQLFSVPQHFLMIMMEYYHQLHLIIATPMFLQIEMNI